MAAYPAAGHAVTMKSPANPAADSVVPMKLATDIQTDLQSCGNWLQTPNWILQSHGNWLQTPNRSCVPAEIDHRRQTDPAVLLNQPHVLGQTRQ